MVTKVSEIVLRANLSRSRGWLRKSVESARPHPPLHPTQVRYRAWCARKDDRSSAATKALATVEL